LAAARLFIVGLGVVALLASGCDDTPVGEGVDDAGGDSGGDASGPDAWAPPTQLDWTPCGAEVERIECADLEVPRDAATLEGSVSLRLTRAPALDPEARVGVLLVNPGGPGAPSDGLVETLAQMPGHALIAQRFDIVGVDWRGTGQSLPAIACLDADDREAMRALDPVLDDLLFEATLADMLVRCRADVGDAFAESLTAAAAAQDLDWVRMALGEEQVSFLGISYGTRLGATYATLFPSRVRAFVLDAAVPPTTDFRDWLLEGAEARNAVLERFFEACGRDAGCRFHGGNGPNAVAEAWDALRTSLQGTEGVPAGDGRRVRARDFVEATGLALAGGYQAFYAQALAELAQGNGTPMLQLADAAEGRRPDGTYDHMREANLAIVCADLFGPGRPSQAELAEAIAEAHRLWPRVAGARSVVEACEEWTIETPSVPIDAAEAPPLLVFAGLYDPSTPAVWAHRMLDALGNGSYLIESDHEGHATALRGRFPMLNRLRDYLLEPHRKPDEYSCQRTVAWPTQVGAPTFNVGGSVTLDPPHPEPIDITIEVLRRSDDTVLATLSATAAGEVVRTPLETGGAPLDIYVRASAPGYRPRETTPARPILGDYAPTLPLLSNARLQELFPDRTLDPTHAAATFALTDCDLQGASGATLELAPAEGVTYHFRLGTGSTTCYAHLTAPTTDTCGGANVMSLPPGNYRPAYVVGADVRVEGRPFEAREGVTHTVHLRP
jgi:pimeloyl-ACP methyl ester carboxylesterase